MSLHEFVVPLSDGSRAVFQWPTSLTQEDVADLKDSLKIVERQIAYTVEHQALVQAKSLRAPPAGKEKL